MARLRYEFNPVKLVFEQVRQPWHKKLLVLLGYFSAAVVSSVLVISLAYTFLDSPKEKQLKEELAEMEWRYQALDRRLDLMRNALAELEQRDRNIYRVIFEAEPLGSNSAPQKSDINAYSYLATYQYGALMATTALKTEKLSRTLLEQSQSYRELGTLIRQKNR
ncbi:MAG: M23 family peptidase, partial [Cytophagia bacterium]|nr:M23 family peptidase [Cytophagia bacterium]